MFDISDLPNDHPALRFSPLVRAIEKTIQYIVENDGIELTPLNAFKRKFVNWSVKEFDWPHYREEDVFSLQKVINEPDFLPAVLVHDLLFATKFARHSERKFKLSKSGKQLKGHPGQIFNNFVSIYLFRYDHRRMTRFGDPPIEDWNTYLNILNLEVETARSGSELRTSFFGRPPTPRSHDKLMSDLYFYILRPLCWAGFLSEQCESGFPRWEESIFQKTALWSAALKLSTDSKISQRTYH